MLSAVLCVGDGTGLAVHSGSQAAVINHCPVPDWLESWFIQLMREFFFISVVGKSERYFPLAVMVLWNVMEHVDY